MRIVKIFFSRLNYATLFLMKQIKDRDAQSLPNDDQPGLSVVTLPTPPS